MILTRQRIVYLLVLGAGALALIADRAFFSPAASQAAPPIQAPAAASAAGAAPAAQAQPAPPAPAYPESPAGPMLATKLRMQIPGWELRVRDAFKADEMWIPPQITGEAQVEAGTDDAEVFAKSHKLTSHFLTRDGAGSVVVNGKLLSVGQELDGWQLLEMGTDGSALFQRGDRSVRLMRADAPEPR